jgi:hypothetical protein
MPRALSRARELVDITGTSTTALPPNFMMAPLPNWRSTCVMALSSAFSLSLEIDIITSLL